MSCSQSSLLTNSCIKLNDFPAFFSGIGNGRKESALKPYNAKPTYNCVLLNSDKIEQCQPLKKGLIPYVASGTILMEKETSLNDDAVEEESCSSLTTGALFHCPNSFCSAEYIRHYRLQEHIMSGVCKVRQLTTNTENFGK